MVGVVEGVEYAVVDCRDYDHFVSLPEVVEYQGRQLGKTGWNSDNHRAYYQNNAIILHTKHTCRGVR
jgi:hypothetical protein